MPIIGRRVMVRAKGDFFAFCDGWSGVVTGINNGYFEVKCQRQDGEKTLFVPPDELVYLP